MNFPVHLDLWSLFGSSFLAATLLPGGSEVVFALLAAQNVHSPSLLIGVATLGNTLGGMVTLGMGRLLARRYPMRALEKPSHQRASRWLHKYGPLSLLWSWVPVIGDPLCFVAGWLRLNFLLALVFITMGKCARYAALWSVTG
ncbi:DedA family protein [Nitrosococcus wardiae]|uniref:DedA family protein n=1 Tax=Nitrosococcus wardiae TaxID=1814290 RepID=A0A4P7BVZ8_9GAMM|nr:YqaA family protein [Nitrosococcus wardiae]QBQ53254.1 DedA family protein [Nitrosococcus wardiae]